MKRVGAPVDRTKDDNVGCINECLTTTGTVNDAPNRAHSRRANALQ
jgi:hypothetical protein